MSQSEQINELLSALSKAQGEMAGAAKDSNNPFFKSKYADLTSVWGACREPLSKNGLSIIQTVQQKDGIDVLCTMLGHASGQWISSTMPLRFKTDAKTNELQMLGTTMTYLRRFSLAAIVGVAPADDDDGNSSTAFKAGPDSFGKQSTNQEGIRPGPAIVSEQQTAELRTIIGKCDKGYKNHIAEFLKKGGLKDLSVLPLALYDSIKKQSIQNLERYQNELSQQNVIQDDLMQVTA